MKRRSRSSPPSTKRTFTEPGTPGQFTSDLARDQLHNNFPGASPASTKKSAALRKRLFHTSMVLTRAATSAPMDSSSTDSSDPTAPAVHRTPPDQILDNIIIDEAPRAPREPQERDPPDLHDFVTQQTEILAGMLAERRARQAAPIQPANVVEPPADPHFDWSRLMLPAETSFQVPGDGQVQRMASSLFARVPTLTCRDQHEARFVLQVISLWPDLDDEERKWAFQRLNVYCIVAALGWAAATAACASTSATTDFVLPPRVVLPPPATPRRNRRDYQPAPQQQQQQQPAVQPQRQQQPRQQNRRHTQRGRGGGAPRNN